MTEPKVQLAEEWDGETVPEHAVVEEKLDGLRGILQLTSEGYRFISRKGNRLNNVGHIARELMKTFAGCTVDGEIHAGDWSEAMSAARSKERGDESLRFRAFDVLPTSDFKRRRCDLPFRERREALELGIRAARPKFTTLTSQVPVRTPAQVWKATERFIARGFEGGVLKDLDAPYAFRRSASWSKVKKFKSGDYRIVGFEEGDGKHEGRLGALLVRGPKGVVSGVGTGFEDHERAAFWRGRKRLLGKVAEIKYFEIGANGALRFPSFLRLRPDK